MDPAVEAEADWGAVFVRLVKYGTGPLRLPLEDAKQVAQEALRRHFDPDYANRDCAKYPTLLLFLGSTMNGIASSLRQKSGHRSELLTREGFLPDQAKNDASPEERVSDADFAKKAVSKLLEKSASDNLVQDVIMAMLEEVDTAAAQGALLNVDVTEIYRARERLKALVKTVRTEMEAS